MAKFGIEATPFGLLWLYWAAFFGLLTVGGITATALLGHTRFGRRRIIDPRRRGARQRRTEWTAAPLILLFDATVITLMTRAAWVRYELVAPLPRTLLLLLAMYAWFELWFYATHRLIHTRPLFFVHARHHVSRVTHPLTSLSFSLTERAIYHLGIPIGFVGLSRLTPVPAATVLGFFAVTHLANAFIHSNVELAPAWLVHGPVGRVLGTASFHALHHARGVGRYGFTSPLFDHLFGTVSPDFGRTTVPAAGGRAPR